MRERDISPVRHLVAVLMLRRPPRAAVAALSLNAIQGVKVCQGLDRQLLR